MLDPRARAEIEHRCYTCGEPAAQACGTCGFKTCAVCQHRYCIPGQMSPTWTGTPPPAERDGAKG